jgi:hypothetical protein
MRKIIKLTENDLMRIVKRVINEQSLSFESKLITKGFEKVNNNTFVKKIPEVGDFYFRLKNDGADITILNPNNSVISKFKLNQTNKANLGFKSEVEADRISDFIVKSFGTNDTTTPTPTPMNENRFDFENMSDEELHDLHPEVKGHPKHFKNHVPTSEYLGWRGEVNKRGIYKRSGKYHNSFTDKKKEE